MNQKGFAVTSVLYGLAILGMMVIVILMGTLSSSRNNVNEEAKSTEDMLLSYGESQVTFTSNKSYTVPEDGWYRIEAFEGAKSSGGGMYITGIVKLTKNMKLFLTIPDDGATRVNKDSASGMLLMSTTGSGGPLNLPGDPKNSSSGGPYPFVDCLIIPNVNYHEGKIIIQKVADQLQRKNTLLDDVDSISITGGGMVYYSYGDGKYIGSCSGTCSHINNKLDDLVIVPSGSYSSIKTDVKVTVNGTKIIYQSKSTSDGPPYGISSGSYGIHFSAYQPDWTVEANISDNLTDKITKCVNKFPDHGTYYLLPVNSKNMAISGYSNPEYSLNSLKLEYLNGEESQKWTIDVINIPNYCPDAKGTSVYPNVSSSGLTFKEYRIVNTASYNALQIYQDENYPENYTISSQSFNTMSRNEPQIWHIMPLNDGTFAIKTSVPSAWKNLNRSGFLYGDTSNQFVKIGVAKNNTEEYENKTFPTSDERFYLYSLY